ncbi:hypothetical protein [Pedobacter paludis]|uniref:Uncharacterized protein n=1 Tax=Pedobacter paludis TaxID=2203212 RepID=A0A317F2C2_9SPHI|nr:hypothetical protein [Pedobacter paludis]PWS33380.1 hypothetical protein DF947_01770 [Pedobacter paludis]
MKQTVLKILLILLGFFFFTHYNLRAQVMPSNSDVAEGHSAKNSNSMLMLPILGYSAAQQDSLDVTAIASEYLKKLKDPSSEVKLALLSTYLINSNDTLVMRAALRWLKKIIKKKQLSVNVRLGLIDLQSAILLKTGQGTKALVNQQLLLCLAKKNNISNIQWERNIENIKTHLRSSYEKDLQMKSWNAFVQKFHSYLILTDYEVLPEFVNNNAWDVFLNVSDPRLLKIALTWMNRLLSIHSNATFTDTKANLLYKIGKRNKAIELQRRVIEMARVSGEPLTEFETTLQKMIQGR